MSRKQKYTVHRTYELNEIIPLLSKDVNHIKIGNKSIKTGNRLRTYIKGVKCLHCGIEGNIFRYERATNNKESKPHLNLYHITNDNDYILMTSDHIKPKSKGGKNSLDNRQCLCTNCNRLKDNIYEGD